MPSGSKGGLSPFSGRGEMAYFLTNTVENGEMWKLGFDYRFNGIDHNKFMLKSTSGYAVRCIKN